MPTEDAYSSGHLVLSHFGPCMCSNVETNLSWTCIVSGPLNVEHLSVLLFCFGKMAMKVCLVWSMEGVTKWGMLKSTTNLIFVGAICTINPPQGSPGIKEY